MHFPASALFTVPVAAGRRGAAQTTATANPSSHYFSYCLQTTTTATTLSAGTVGGDGSYIFDAADLQS